MRASFVAAGTMAFCLLWTGRASATTVTANSYSNWLTDVNGTPIELNFSGVQTGKTYSNSSGVTLNPISGTKLPFIFTGPDNTGYNLAGTTFTQYGRNFIFLEGASDGIGSISIALPTGGENAIYLSLDSTNNTSLTVKLSDGETFTSPAGPFGLALSQDITWLSVSTSSGSHPLIDDFFFGTSNLPQQTQAFEVATFFLMGTGLLVLAGARRTFAKRIVS
jgi:hypothetical protein